MLFSSFSFLLYFFPLVVLVHYILPKKLQNLFLLLASLFFYAWGDIQQVPLFVILLVVNWIIGFVLGKKAKPSICCAFLVTGLVIDFGTLIFYKYAGFFLGILGFHPQFVESITLPLGISFFVFQAAGYLIDVFRQQIKPERDPISFGAFLFLFPQLIAGPIVRYSDMAKALHEKRRPNAQMLEYGTALFVTGLAAKVLLANPLGEAYTELYSMTGDMLCAWTSLIAYTLQIYFDFLGYSVMAIALGQMLGFSLPRNFNQPYTAVSVTDFWRRWHMTLSGWFRDYVYIPLGGNRKGMRRTICNLFVVWGLTGLWHGADWNFLLWGLWYFLLLCIEKFVLKNRILFAPWLQRTITLLCVMLGWALFVSDGLDGFMLYLSSLFSFHTTAQAFFWIREFSGVILLGIVFCIPTVVKFCRSQCRKSEWLCKTALIGMLVLCLASLAKSSYNPFLYFRF